VVEHRPGQVPLSSAHTLMNSRPIAVHRNVMAIAGTAVAGIFLSQLIYWTRRGVEVVARNGWVYKTAEQWAHETGMTWKVQRRARKQLLNEGLMEERKVAVPCRLEFRLNLNELAKRTSQFIHIHLDEQSLTLDLFRSDNEVIKQLLGQITAYHRRLASIVPHVHDALLLSRLLQDQGRSERWQTRSRPDWLRELGMSRDEWETSRRHLTKLGLTIERSCNYPRRVEMMVDPRALARRLEQLTTGTVPRPSTSTKPHPTPDKAVQADLLEAGGDRAKQDDGKAADRVNASLGGIGRNRKEEIPPTVSPNPSYPDPAFKDRPIPPLSIAQSPLYMKEGLQGSLQQPLQAQTSLHTAPTDRHKVVGVVDEVSTRMAHSATSSNAVLKVARVGPPDAQPSPAGPRCRSQDLFWPKFMAPEDHPVVWWQLMDFEQPRAQIILDEMAWNHSRKPVGNPAGLARKLIALDRQGLLIPEGAHRVADSRRQQQAMAEAVAAASAAPAAPPSGPKSEQEKASFAPSAEIRAKLAAATKAYKIQIAGGKP
jgi:hypothetical protein